MTTHAGTLPRSARERRWPALTRVLTHTLRWPHLPGLGLQFGVGLWLCRAYADSGLPAGTDMLGFVSRAAVNARGSTWLSGWDPDSLGAPRQLTLESLLGVLTKLSGNPVVTVKLFVLTTLVVSGLGAYWLTWRWYHTRLGAGIAGVLYTTSQISLAQTASGHLNVCMILALAPFVIGLTVDGVESFSARRAVLLGAALALLILARPDMALYLVPSVLLYVPVRGLVEQRVRESLRNGVLTAAVALGTAIVLSLYDVVPVLAGVRAEWLSSGGLFQLQEFNARSVPALGSLLGFAREIGYLAFTNRQTWVSNPWVSFGVYAALALIPVAAAWGALALRRDSRTIYLLGCVLFGAFAAKGMHSPLGGPYEWAALHVPFFANLRDPDRWLIAGSLAVAVLAGFSASQLPALLRWLDASRPARALIAVAVTALVLLPNAPTVLPGLATWRPTAGQLALLHDAATGDSPLATVPFDQTRRFVVDGSYAGWEHDLGAESSLWTGRPALADGGWSSSASGTISYLTTLLGRRDPAFAPMLAALGINQVLSFNYSPTAPGLLNQSDPFYQQHALATMPALTLGERTAGGSLYSVDGAAAQLSARPLRAVVLGGLSGLRALVRLHGIVPSDWAAQDAAGLLIAGGEPALLAAIRQANLVMIADTSVNDLAVDAATPLVELPGISSDADLARETQTLPPDVATSAGALIDPDAAQPLTGATSSSVSFKLSDSQPATELWVHVQALDDPASLRFSLDGRLIGSTTPLAPADAGFSWIRIATFDLAAGHHVLSVRASQSPYGTSYELDAVRLLTVGARVRAATALSSALAQAAPRTAYAADLGDGLRTVSDPALFSPVDAIGGGSGYWTALEPDRTSIGITGGALTVAFGAGRGYHALVAHYFARPRNWSAHAYAYLRVRGQDSGATYSVVLDGDARNRYTIQLPWTDDTSGWRLLAIPLLGDPTVARHVTSIRVAADDTSRPGTLQLGAVALSGSADAVVEHLPIPGADASRAELVDQRRTPAARRRLAAYVSGARPGHEAISVRIPLRVLGQHNLLLVPPSAGIPAAAPASLRWKRTGTGSFSFHVHAARPFTLVLGLAQDPHWQLSGVRGAIATRVWGALQAWQLPAGSYSGAISFAGDPLVRGGLELSGLAALLLLGIGGGLSGRLRRDGTVTAAPPTRQRRASAPQIAGSDQTRRQRQRRLRVLIPDRLARLGPPWKVAFLAALMMLAPIPLAVSSGPGRSGDDLAVAATAAMTLAVVLAALDVRRSCADRDS